MEKAHHLFDRVAPGKAIPLKRALRLVKALEAAYGPDAAIVVLAPTNDEEWARAVAASECLHRSVEVHWSMTGINPAVLTSSDSGPVFRWP